MQFIKNDINSTLDSKIFFWRHEVNDVFASVDANYINDVFAYSNSVCPEI